MKLNLGAPEPPSRPQGPLLITEVSNDSVCLEWNPPESDGGREITKYIVQVIMMAKKDSESKDITKYSNFLLPGNGDGRGIHALLWVSWKSIWQEKSHTCSNLIYSGAIKNILIDKVD